MSIILEGKSITKYFGGLAALKNVDIEVKKGEIFGVIGPNGAGKTTLLNILNGLIPPSNGKVILKGQDVTGKRPHTICRLGISRILQTPRPFLSMTVLENVITGAIFGGCDQRGKQLSALERANLALHFLGLHKKSSQPVSNMNLQEKKMVEMARALSTQPDVLLIDEIMSGLNPIEIEQCMNIIRRIRDELGITIVWVEHVMNAIMKVGQRIMVLNYGEVIALGSPIEVARDESVIKAYLGRV